MHWVLRGLGVLMVIGGFATLVRNRGGKISREACLGLLLGVVVFGVGSLLAPKTDSKPETAEPQPAIVSPPAGQAAKPALAKWVDVDGGEMEAELVAVTDEGGEITAIFKDVDGKTYKFPVRRLAAESRARVEATEEYARQIR